MRTDMRMKNVPIVIKGYGVGEEHKKFDKVIDEALQNDNKMDQQHHHSLVMVRCLMLNAYVIGLKIRQCPLGTAGPLADLVSQALLRW